MNIQKLRNEMPMIALILTIGVNSYEGGSRINFSLLITPFTISFPS
jgi:hypothetical protein